MGGRAVDWDYWRKEYVQGGFDVTLRSLSERSNSPALQTLKNRSAEEDWDDQRKRYRRELGNLGAYDFGKQEIKPEVAHVIDQTNKIIDAAEMLTQHNKLAKALIAVGAASIAELKKNDYEKAKKMKPNEAMNFILKGIDIQRTTEGLATSKTEIDFVNMSDTDLDAFINGDA